MIRLTFNNWTLSARATAPVMRGDDGTVDVVVSGIPAGWEWELLIRRNGADIATTPMVEQDGTLATTLTAEQLAYDGYYTMQLRATRAPFVKHSGAVNVKIGRTISGDDRWPEIPTAFTQALQRAEEALEHAENIIEDGVTPLGEWSEETAYDRLDVVSHDAGSYMARQDVPAGTALTEAEYWMTLANTAEAIARWLEAHPEATTTVVDGSITRQKLHQTLSQEITQHGTDINVLESRVDQIIALPDGSTTADGLLNDIKIGWDGTTYDTPGDAVRGQVSDLHDAIQQLDSYFVPGINLFNPNDPDLLLDYKLNNSGTTTAETGKIVSGYIPVFAGGTVCVNYPTGIYGSSSSLVLYDADKQRIGYVNPGRYTDARGNGYLKHTFPSDIAASYFRATGTVASFAEYMYVYADEMPSTYVPYSDKVTLADDVVVPFESIDGVSVSKDDTDFVKATPINLVDFSAMTSGIIKNSSTNGGTDENSSWLTTDFIPVEPGATYALSIFPGVYYGAGFLGIPVYDDTKTQIARVKQPGGSISGIAEGVTITIPDRPDAKYIRASYYKSYIDPSANLSAAKSWYLCQIFKASAWPTDMYMPYDGAHKIIGAGLEPSESAKYNALFGKSAIWNGDSICAADGDPQGGWPGRIASANGMMFRNYGVSGGTIAENTGVGVHSVSGTLDGMLDDFPDADYIIIEGGTNDADILGDNGIGVFDPDDFSTEYIASLDRDTFSGALESVFYRLVTQMKGKHIGYLIPQKMGHTEVLVARRRVYFDRAKAIAQKWGIPVLDLWNDLYFNWRLSAHWDQSMTTTENENAGNLYKDGQHLTTKGYEIEAPVIADWMRTF